MSSWRVNKNQLKKEKEHKNGKKIHIPNDQFFNCRTHKNKENLKERYSNETKSPIRDKSFSRKHTPKNSLTTPQRSDNSLFQKYTPYNERKRKLKSQKENNPRTMRSRNRIDRESNSKEINRNYTEPKIQVGGKFNNELCSSSIDSPVKVKREPTNRRRLTQGDFNDFQHPLQRNHEENLEVNRRHTLLPSTDYENRETIIVNTQNSIPPHNPWISRSKKYSTSKGNLNNTEFHIYPKNRKRSSKSPIRAENNTKRSWMPVTKIIKEEGRDRRECIQSFGRVEKPVEINSSFSRYDNPYGKKKQKILVTNNNMNNSSYFNPPARIAAAENKNSQNQEKIYDHFQLCNSSYVDVNDVEKLSYDRGRKTAAEKTEKIKVKFF